MLTESERERACASEERRERANAVRRMMTHTEWERGSGESERERREMGERKRESIPEERLVFTHR